MGCEFKILTRLSDQQKKDIENIFNHHRFNLKKHRFNGDELWDFIDLETNPGEMPNFTIIFQSDGLYILKNDIGNVWNDLNELKDYFQNNKIDILVKDYEE
jgi:hypothetical protein